MDGLSKIKCHMFNGIGFEHPRTGLRVPAELGELEVKPWQRSELEQDPRVFVEGNERDEAAKARIAEGNEAAKAKAKDKAAKAKPKRSASKTDKAPKPKRRSSRS